MNNPTGVAQNSGDILIVDDDLDGLKLLAKVLSNTGYSVRSTSNGELALRSVQAKHPDLILLDIKMPGIDGLEVCQRLKADETTRDIPIIFISAVMDAETKAKGIELGALDFITKPYHAKELLGRVHLFIELKNRLDLIQLQNRKIKESEMVFRSIAETATDAIVTADNEGKVILWNLAAERIFGYASTEIIGKPLTMLMPERFRAQHNAGIARIKAGGEKRVIGRTVELVGLHKDGSEFPIELSISTWEAGGKACFTGIIRNIGRRKLEEEKLKQSNEELKRSNTALKILSEGNKALITSVDEGELLKSVCHTIVHVGQFRFAWVGIVAQDEAKTLRPVASFGIGDGYLDVLNISLTDEKRGSGPTAIAIKNNTPYVVYDIETEDRFAPWREEAHKRGYRSSAALPMSYEGEVVGSLNIYSEKTNTFGETEVGLLLELASDLAFGLHSLRERAEKDRTTKELYSLMVTATDAIITADDEGKVIIWNRAAERIFGYASTVIIGKPLTMLMPERFRAQHNAGIARMKAGGEKRVIGKTVELVGLHKDGSEFPMELSISTWEAGGKACFTGIIRDITERKQAENRLEQSNEELKNALQNLETSQALLMRSDKLASVGTLAAGVAHEILNPLNIISTIVQMMMYEEKWQSENENLQEIMDQIHRASKITNNLKVFARPKKMEIAPLDINAMFDDTVALMEHDLNLDNITVERDYDPDLPLVYADEGQLAQVALNLLNNSRDAMKPSRKGSINIKTRKTDGGIEIRFGDTGPGIPKDIIGKIFDPFFSTKEPGKGTGLGLSITYRIIEGHNGSIMVESVEGVGTCFTINLPIGDRRVEMR